MNEPEGMREFLIYHRRMLIGMIVACLAATVGLCLATPGDFRLAGGFAAGAAAQLFKFGFLDVRIIRKIATERERTAATQMKAMFLSLVVFGLSLLATLRLGWNVWATAAGIFLPRLILIADTWFRPNPFGTVGGKPGAE